MPNDIGFSSVVPARRWSDRIGDPPPFVLRREETSRPRTEDARIIGESHALRSVLEQARLFAQCDAPVLITGESGTGKELLAKYIHRLSPVRAGPFTDVNCAGIPSTLISSELFGHEKGAFTDAVQRRIGCIEAADRGTLFLDEIGDMPVDLQPVLLRFLEEGKIQRVGGHQSIRLNVRIIAATNQNLDRHVENGRFRQDLLFRLNILTLDMPPLRNRGSDVLLLAAHALRRWPPPEGCDAPQLTDEAKAALLAHDWPGNVRELMGRIRRAVVLAQGKPITTEHLSLAGATTAPRRQDETPGPAGPNGSGNGAHLAIPLPCTLEAARAEVERTMLDFELKRCRNNLSAVARNMGISRGTLYRLLDQHDMAKEAPGRRER